MNRYKDGRGSVGSSPWARETRDARPVPAEEASGSGERRELQINIQGDAATIERFRRLCREDRRTYAEMLRILMDNFEAGT